jgi:hypothetical protein
MRAQRDRPANDLHRRMTRIRNRNNQRAVKLL